MGSAAGPASFNRRAAVLLSALQAVRGIMEGVISLEVPLIVNIKAGERWGSMQPEPAAQQGAPEQQPQGTPERQQP
jgi:hypothetical protein